MNYFISGNRSVTSWQMTDRSQSRDKIVLKTRQGFVFLQTEEIQWIEAEAQYCLIHCNSETIRVRKSISEFEGEMDSRMFVRVSRSVVLNLNHVRLLRPWRKGDYEVVMNDGATLHWSRSFKNRLDELLGRIRIDSNNGDSPS